MNNLYRATIMFTETRLEALPIGSALEEGGIKVEKVLSSNTHEPLYIMYILCEYGWKYFFTNTEAVRIECEISRLATFIGSKDYYKATIDNSPEMEELRKENLEEEDSEESEDDE